MLGFQNGADSDMIERNSRNPVNFFVARTAHDLQISKPFKSETPVCFVVNLQRAITFANITAESSTF